MNLPTEPIDGYVVRWFEVAGDSKRVSECTATYHRNSEYTDHQGRAGQPLVDQWMIASDGYDRWRLDGWHVMHDWIERDRVDMHTTRASALVACRATLSTRISRLQATIKRLEQTRKGLS